MKNDIETLLDNIEKHLTEHYKDYVEGAIETTKYGIYCDDLRLLSNYITNLKERIDKAIEYITCPVFNGKNKKPEDVLIDLLNILQGKDKGDE